MKKTFLALTIVMACLANMTGQTGPGSPINDFLDGYIGTNARPYLQPAADLLTANINTGVWDWTAIPDKVYFRIKVNGMVSYPSESMKTFTAHTSGDFMPDTSVIAPTVIGDEQSILIYGENKAIYVFPGGFNVDKVALGTPQVTIGGFWNIELSARFLTMDIGEDNGKIDFYGVGGRYGISGLFDDPPVDFSVGYFYHHINAGSYVRTSQHLLSLMAGKSGKILDAHISLGYQLAKPHLHYFYEDVDLTYNVDIDMQNNNPFIAEAGLGVRLGPVFVNGAVSYARFYTFALGAGVFF